MSQIIGIIGFKGSGKDTVGDYLVEQHGFEKFSFAASLKDAIAAIFGWDRSMMEGDTKESREWREQPDVWWEEKLGWSTHPGRYLNERFTPRVAMQYMGTDLLRNQFHDSIWILSLQRQIMTKEKVVITDCRFSNEFNLVKAMGGKVFRVKRGPEPDWLPTALLAGSGDINAQAHMKSIGIHQSEYEWLGLNFDAVLENNDTIASLHEATRCQL